MKYVSPDYHEQLRNLGETLARRPAVVQDELDLGGYAEVSDVLCECVIERPEAAQLGRTATFGWDSEGTYLDRD